ncbi:glucosaminidase domain-containing protein [Tessaracoccus sp. OH4464_COT-324]|uniref:glucosaminidase domain-containing protein n=1 Tax=Tessaracoccus sp. OH4464_COT-324 TaxID=2491059 RepID=UPI000F644AA9|nr:glucosaminidase domain-containing protein [Tessaracoccus sp. OH4464_COT-324]RRD46996.1 hypothetical protein EII42_04750 [Tessaracoccus sp. OH4464_COT-324]
MRTLRKVGAALVAAVLLLGIFSPRAEASSRQRDFIAKLVSAAQQTQREYGIPASVTLGMAALETGWGRSSMTREPINTLFNIKCTKTASRYQKGCAEVASYEYRADGTRYLEVSRFRTYANWGDSVKDFGLFLSSLKRYRKAFDHKNDPDAFVREVRRGGYATDPRYADLVISIMRSHNLYRYDLKSQPSQGIAGKPKLPVAKEEFTTLTHGSRNNNVVTAQRLLNQAGARLAEDGRYGWVTQQAVAEYQHRTFPGKEISGDVDRATWVSLVPTLRQGDRGPLVKILQQELEFSGYEVAIDGSFGAQTRGIVEDVQRRHSLPVTGVADEKTWGKLVGM